VITAGQRNAYGHWVASCVSCKRTGMLTSKVSCTWLVYVLHVFRITGSFAVNPEAAQVSVFELKRLTK